MTQMPTWRQKKWIISTLAAIFIVFIWPYFQSAIFDSPVTPAPGWYYVSYVYDGDTIAVNMGGSTEKIRLIGVDTPETHKPGAPVQCYGVQASAATSDKLLYSTVRLEADPTNDDRDRYDRLLRYVYTEDGLLWNQQLIALGAGFAYTSFPFMKKTDFVRSQGEAANLNLGLWGECQTIERNGRWQTNNL